MGPQRAPWPLLGLPRPRRACRRSWVPRAPDTAGSTELRPKGDATHALKPATALTAICTMPKPPAAAAALGHYLI